MRLIIFKLALCDCFNLVENNTAKNYSLLIKYVNIIRLFIGILHRRKITNNDEIFILHLTLIDMELNQYYGRFCQRNNTCHH